MMTNRKAASLDNVGVDLGRDAGVGAGHGPVTQRSPGRFPVQVLDAHAAGRRVAGQGRDPPRHAERSSTASRTRPRPEKLYDNLDFQRAVQAYLLALPAVSQAANRNAIRTLGPVNQTIPIFEQLVDSRSIFLTANDNTVYSWTWLDLRNGPLVLEVPPKVLGAINDMWYRWVVDVGITGPDKGKGGKYLLLPPGYKGEVPKGYIVVRSPTFSIWIPWRSFLVDGDPKPGVELVKKFTKIYPLCQAANPPPG